MTDKLGYEATFEGDRALKGLKQLRDLLKTTKVAAQDSSNSVRESLTGLNRTTIKIQGLSDLTQALNRTRDDTKRSVGDIRRSIEGLPAPLTTSRLALANFAGTLGAIGFGAAIRGVRDLTTSFMGFSDTAGSVDAKLTLATAKFGSLAKAQADVTAISNKSRTDISAVADLYSTMSRNAATLALNQKQVATATQTVGMALKIGGQGASQSAAAILQLSQAMGTGKLAGDEFASLAENAPRLMDLFAAAIGKPRGELKKLASDGKITADVIAKALTDPKLVAGIEAEFGKIPVSFADIKTAAENSAVAFAGAFAKGAGLGNTLAQVLANIQTYALNNKDAFVEFGRSTAEAFASIMQTAKSVYNVVSTVFAAIRDNWTTIDAVVKGVAAGFLFYRAATLVAAASTTAFGQAVMFNGSVMLATARSVGIGAAAQVGFTAATAAAATGVRAFTAALAANPLGLIAVAISTVVSLMIGLSDATDDATKAALAKAEADKLAADETKRRAEFELKLIDMTDAQKKATIEAAKAAIVKAQNDQVAAKAALERAKAELALVRAMGQKQIAEGMRSTAGAGGGIDSGMVAINADERRRTPYEARVKAEEARIAKNEREIKAQEERIKATEKSLSNVNAGNTRIKPTETKKDGKKHGETEAEKAAKKYKAAVDDLNASIKDLTLTEEQKALADELERAGLGRDITQINAKANEIKRLFKVLRDGEQEKKVTEILADFTEKVRELQYSQEQLAMVEARRRAGLTTDLAVVNEQTKRVDAQAAAYYRLQQAKESARTVKDIEKDQTQRKQDLEIDQNGRMNSDKADDERKILQIQRERDANIERIGQLEGVSEAKKRELILNEEILATQAEQGVQYDRQLETVSRVSSFLSNMFENPKQAFKSFIGDVLAGLLEAIAKAIILGDKLGGKGGIGGLLTSVITGAIGGSGGGIAGARATGGSVRAGSSYLIGENGPEVMTFGAAGTIINNRTARKAMGAGGGNNITIGGTNIVIQGGANNDTLAQLKAQQTAYERALMTKIDNRLNQTR